MILVADSGSTKCDWAYAGPDGNPLYIESAGLNPTFHNSEKIAGDAGKAFSQLDTDLFTQVFFYGAGCSSEHNIAIVKAGLQQVFPKALLHISHDLEGSAIATCSDKEGIACILGTGSNACIWDGKNIMPQVPVFGMSYILGDEGSGAYLGKLLLKAFFYNRMPDDLRQMLKANGINKSHVEEQVYNKPGANVYLASFTRFIYENRQHSFIQELIAGSFTDFFETHILQYDKHREIPVNFVGSIAFLFQEELKNVAVKHNVKIETIIKQPIDNLLRHHMSKASA